MVKRAGIAFLTIIFAVLLTFLLIHMAPGDPCYMWAMQLMKDYGIPFDIAYNQAVQMWGYDPSEPLSAKFVRYMSGLLHGDLGYSMVYRMSVNRIIMRALPWTVFVLAIALLVSFTFGVALGTLIAWRRKGVLDPIITGFASLTAATPAFVIGLILLIFLGINLKWFPTKGAYSIWVTPGFNSPFILDVLHHAALPILAFALEGFGGWALAMKGSAVSVLGEDYVTAAKARGLRERRIMVSYVTRNSILPLVTTLAIALGGMLGGSMLVEMIFNYPGIGYFFSDAVGKRDYGMMQGLFLLVTVATVLANLLADFLYAKLDPRVKLT